MKVFGIISNGAHIDVSNSLLERNKSSIITTSAINCLIDKINQK